AALTARAMDDVLAPADLARPPCVHREKSRPRQLFARAVVPGSSYRCCEASQGSETRMTPIVAVGAFVFDVESRVLLVERGQPPGVGLWTVPGGKLDPGETLVRAVSREVREETGLTVEVGT